MKTSARHDAQGLTLIEVLVALVIISLALAAASRASIALLNNSERNLTALLANTCANNILANIKVSRQFPSIGKATSACDQFGMQFRAESHFTSSMNPNFRRVDILVYDADGKPAANISGIVSRY